MPNLSESAALALLRITAGLLIFSHGLQKLLKGPVSAIGSAMVAHGFPASLAYGVTLGELAGLLLALGLYPRLAAIAAAVTLWGILIFVQAGRVMTVGTGSGTAFEYPLLLAVAATLFIFLPTARWSVGKSGRR